MILEKYRIEYENGVIQEKYLVPGNSNDIQLFFKDSPLYNAIETGILKLPKEQGGDHKVKITKI